MKLIYLQPRAHALTDVFLQENFNLELLTEANSDVVKEGHTWQQ